MNRSASVRPSEAEVLPPWKAAEWLGKNDAHYDPTEFLPSNVAITNGKPAHYSPIQVSSPHVTTTNGKPVTTQPPQPVQAEELLDSDYLQDKSMRNSRRHTVRLSTLRRPMGQFGQCGECKGTKTGFNWCQYCNNELFQKNFANWTSGSKEIDDFIQEAQLKATNVRSILEWIDYEEFTDVNHLANGGNSSV